MVERRELTREPSHPGAVMRLELEELGLTVTETARRLGVARRSVSELVNERRGVSPEMALRLGRFFGNGTGIWLTMQTHYDHWRIEHDAAALKAAAAVEPAA